jgi:hypothetical protein
MIAYVIAPAMAVIGMLTIVSGLLVVVRMPETLRSPT